MNRYHEIYYSAAVRLGTSLICADGSIDEKELKMLKKYFSISARSFPKGARIFNEQIKRPVSTSDILGEFRDTFRNSPEVKENFMLGMTYVAIADGRLHQREEGIILDACKVLGINPVQAYRIFSPFKWHAASQPRETSKLERHLKMLGLTGKPAKDEIDQAYRALVRRYHPDSLRAQHLPPGEIARSEELLKEINHSYRWIQENY